MWKNLIKYMARPFLRNVKIDVELINDETNVLEKWVLLYLYSYRCA